MVGMGQGGERTQELTEDQWFWEDRKQEWERSEDESGFNMTAEGGSVATRRRWR